MKTMKYIWIISILSLTNACAQKNPSPTSNSEIPILAISMYHSPKIDTAIALNNPYDATFRVIEKGDGQFVLLTSIKLHGGSFYVSPHSTGDFKGKFRVEVAPNDDLEIGSDFIEIPRSPEVIDLHRFVNGPVNWVTQDTQYEYPLILSTDQDFSIGGKLVFVIEPKCTLEELPIMFKFENGVLTVEPWEC